MLKLMRGYLNHVQNSVFEGELTDAQLEELKHKISQLMKPEEDSVIIYCLGSSRYYNREVIGVEKSSSDQFV